MLAQAFFAAAALRMALLSYPLSPRRVAPRHRLQQSLGFLTVVDLSTCQSQNDGTTVSSYRRRVTQSSPAIRNVNHEGQQTSRPFMNFRPSVLGVPAAVQRA